MGKFDEILDDVVVNAKTAASAVSKKAVNVYDASRHKITAAEIRGEINKKLRDLGKFTYKARVYNIDMDAQIDATVAEITELKDNLEKKKCPQCEAKIPRNSVYCNICGAKIDEADEIIGAVDTPEETVEADAEKAVEAEPENAGEAAE